MDISTAYKQHQQIITLQNDLAEVLKEIKITEWAYRLAFIATFVVYFVFVWMMYVSDLWGFTTWLIENLSEIAALIIYTVLAITLPLSMAMIKEIGYKHFAKYRNNWAIVGLIVFILAFAGVVYESISSSSQQQHISTSAAEKSKTFQVITNTKPNTIKTSSMASLIAEAQKQLARCEEKLKDGREPHCKGDHAKLQGYIDSEQRAMDSAERASTAAIKVKTEALKELKEDSYKPAFKAIRDSFGVTISTGVMLVTTFISVIFEISHLLLILFLSQKLRRKDWLTQSIINLEAAYLNSTGKAFRPEDFTDDSVLNMDDVREQSPAQMGFGIPATSQFKYQKAQQGKLQPVGFIRTDHLQQPEKSPIQNRANSKLGTAETQLEIPQIQQPETSTYNQELSEHGIHSPDDEALNQEAEKAGIQRIIEKGLKANGEATKPRKDPAHGLSDEKPRVEPRAHGQQEISTNPAHRVSNYSETVRQAQTSTEHESLYPVWVEAVQEKECRPSVDGTRKWIQKRIAPLMTGSKTNDLKRIDGMRKAFFNRAMHDGLMEINDKYRNGGKKYLWIG